MYFVLRLDFVRLVLLDETRCINYEYIRFLVNNVDCFVRRIIKKYIFIKL
jgi:hypothetical protein